MFIASIYHSSKEPRLLDSGDVVPADPSILPVLIPPLEQGTLLSRLAESTPTIIMVISQLFTLNAADSIMCTECTKCCHQPMWFPEEWRRSVNVELIQDSHLQVWGNTDTICTPRWPLNTTFIM